MGKRLNLNSTYVYKLVEELRSLLGLQCAKQSLSNCPQVVGSMTLLESCQLFQNLKKNNNKMSIKTQNIYKNIKNINR